MLEVDKHSVVPDRDINQGASSPAEELTTYLNIIRRQLPVIILIVACTTALGLTYLFTATSKYTASARMIIDTTRLNFFQQQPMSGDFSVDSAAVETQVEILKSKNISLAVIKNLHLTSDPEFVASRGGLIGAVAGFLSSIISPDEPTAESDLTNRALDRFENQREISRVGLSYAMDIQFTSVSPVKAAQIANAISDAYITDQLESKYQATRRASKWLLDRIKELRAQATAATQAVVDFKQKNNIVDTGGGQLMNEQQVAAVSSQLILAKAATAEAKAKLDRIDSIMKSDIPDESVADALQDQTIIQLRNQYVQLKAQEADWAARFGRNHLAVVHLRNQMADIRRTIRGELKQIQAAYQSNYDIARTRERSIKNSLANTVSESQLTNQAQVKLQELESNEKTYQAMYDNFLQAYMQITQQETFPITQARLISPALAPSKRSQPKTLIVLGVAIAGGMMLSFGVAVFRELTDKVFRTSGQIEEILGVNNLAVIPIVKGAATRSPLRKDGLQRAEAQQHIIARNEDLFWYVVDSPFSRFTESVRSIKVAVDLNGAVKENKIIGITSSLPNEGKSTLAANFAQLIAHAGGRVLLVDLDLRNPSLSRSLAPDAAGVVDIISGKFALRDAAWTDLATNLTFLPAGATPKMLHTNEIIASAAMKKFFEGLRSAYDYIIVDLAPLAPVVDARTTTTFVDSYVYVVEWGRTKIDIVERSLSDARGVYDRLLGVVLNKADTAVLGRYEGYHGNYYHNKYYARYGYTE